MDNRKITQSALALWTALEPLKALEEIGFVTIDEAGLEKEDICLIVDVQEGSLAFGMMQKMDENTVTFIYYEEINGTSANCIQFPKKNIMVYKLKNTGEDHYDHPMPPTDAIIA